ncbi:MAG: GxxExxY protein [Planctomycetota bacterium]
MEIDELSNRVLIENHLNIELKSIEMIKGIHEARLLTSMKRADNMMGLLVNFNNTSVVNVLGRFKPRG